MFGRIVGAAAGPWSATGDAIEHWYAFQSAVVGDLIGGVPEPVAVAEIDRDHAPVAWIVIVASPLSGDAHSHRKVP